MGERRESIAIIGGGPAGSCVAALLASAGRDVALFHTTKRRRLIVGESLVPAVVPILRRLGVEDEVARVSVIKPGATIGLSPAEHYRLPFEDAAGTLPAYSYNTPRDRFDAILLDAAQDAGAHLISRAARVTRSSAQGVRLTPTDENAATEALGGRRPGLIIDASGRGRLLARRLHLPAIVGDRRDVALFAHYEGTSLESRGDIHVDRNQQGWSWRIPLPGKVSVGVVVNPRFLPQLAPSDQRDRGVQLDAFIAADPALSPFINGPRLTPAERYDNYQVHSPRLVGPGWALVGDAAGFADPIFSTGTYLALRGAEMLADAILSEDRSRMQAYADDWLSELGAWRRIIDLWYDGRLFSLLRIGGFMRRLPPARPVDQHIGRHLTRIFTGEVAAGGYGRALLAAIAPVGLVGARQLAIR